jgi:hypothetical protein
LRISQRVGKPIKTTAKIFKQAAVLERNLSRVLATLRRLRATNVTRSISGVLDIGSDLQRKLKLDEFSKLYDIFLNLGEEAIKKFRLLSQKAKAALLGCHSPCNIKASRIQRALISTGKIGKELNELIHKSGGKAALEVARKIHGLNKVKEGWGQVVAVVRLKDGRWVAGAYSGKPFTEAQKAALSNAGVVIAESLEGWLHAEEKIVAWFTKNGVKNGSVDIWGISWKKRPKPCSSCINIVKRWGGTVLEP